MIKKYVKKPIVIEAIQWTGDNLKEITEFAKPHTNATAFTWEEFIVQVESNGLKIYTLEGPMHATISDYIIKGINGEFYPCKEDIFIKTYTELE
jgi:hypothetical protein